MRIKLVEFLVELILCSVVRKGNVLSIVGEEGEDVFSIVLGSLRQRFKFQGLKILDLEAVCETDL
jgi:hypothetical protein